MRRNLHQRIYDKVPHYRVFFDEFKKVKMPFTRKLPLHYVLAFFYRSLVQESIGQRASSIAFNLFLSLFPALIFLFTLLPYLPLQSMHEEILTFFKTLMPSDAFATIDGTLRDILEHPRANLLSVGLLTALYFASNGVFSLLETFNKHDKRSFWWRRLEAILIALAMGGLLLIDLTILLLGQSGISTLLNYFHVAEQFTHVSLLFIQWLMMFLLIFVSCTILFYFGEPKRDKWRFIYPGAFLSTLLTLLTSVGYAFYVNHFANYNKLYGSLGALIITMLWLYFNSMVLIAGHEFNRSLRHTRKLMNEEGAEEKVE